MAQVSEVPYCCGRTGTILDLYLRECRPSDRFAYRHQGNAEFRELAPVMRRDRPIQQQHAIHLAGAHDLHHVPSLAREVSVQVANEQSIAVRHQRLVDAAQHVGKERIGDIRHDNKHHHAASCPQAPGGQVRRVAGLPYRLLDACKGRWPKLGRHGERATHGCDRDAGQHGNVLDPDHPAISCDSVHNTFSCIDHRLDTHRNVTQISVRVNDYKSATANVQGAEEGKNTMKRILVAGVCLAALLTSQSASAQRAEVIHWWTSGGESAAVRVFAEQYAKAGGTWVDTAIAGGVNARAAAINRTVGGDPPTAMQFNTGKQFDDLVENDLLSDVDAQAKAEKWTSIMPAAIVNAVSRNGHFYAVPVDIHGQNWFFYNTAVLEKLGLQAPTNWNDLFPILDRIKAAGIVPLAFSGQKTWERGLFNTVLVGQGGPEMFTAFWGKRDPALAKSPEFRAVAETFRRLHSYIDAGAAGRNWNDATSMVIQGKAGMQAMGDWAKGEFTAAGQTAGKEYGCTILSNKGTGYLIGGDVFAFPKQKNAESVAAQQKLASVLLEPATQIAFSQKKGSIPARLDLDVSVLDVCARKAVAWLADKNAQVPANELLAPPAVTGAAEDIISQYWNEPAMTTDSFVQQVTAAVSQAL